MRRLFPLLIVVFIIFLLGDSGVFAYGRLERYRDDLAANVDALTARHEALEKELTQLKTNSETTIALARSLGLYAPGDRVVQLAGRTAKNEVYAMGDLLHMSASPGTRSPVFKMIACIIAAFLILAGFISARALRRRAVGSQGR
jgi:cell division protein FtsB